MKKYGFTLLELLAVIVIIGLLFTFGSRALRAARINARKARAMVEMSSIETAAKAYMNKYGKLPTASLVVQGAADVQIDYSESSASETESKAIVSVLTKADDMDPADNPAGMVFLDPQSDGADGTFLDPWGRQYRIALDTDYDGKIVVDGETVRRKVAVASVGLHLQTSNTNDLIKSWQ